MCQNGGSGAAHILDPGTFMIGGVCMRLLRKCLFVATLLLAIDVRAAGTPAWNDLGGAKLDGWSGVKPADDGSAAILSLPGEARFRYHDGPVGFYKHGFRIENDGTVDLKPFYGIRCQVRLPDARQVELTFILAAATPNGPDTQVAGVVRVAGSGWD